jgi:hypothetical protein
VSPRNAIHFAEINRTRDLSSPFCAFSERICQILQDRQSPRDHLAGGLMRILIVSSKSRCCLALRSTLMVRLSPPSVPSQHELQVRGFAFRPHASESRNNALVNPSETGPNLSGQKPEQNEKWPCGNVTLRILLGHKNLAHKWLCCASRRNFLDLASWGCSWQCGKVAR